MPQTQMQIASPKQLEFWREANHRWNFKVGATRSGKTYMDYFLIPKRIVERKGKEGLTVILGNTRETLRRNIIMPMQSIYGTSRVSNIRSGDNTATMFGETVYCLGADNISHADRIRGSSIKYCYGDEVATWNSEVFEMLKSRLDKSYSCFDGALNPQSPNHWLKKFLDSNADIYQQKYTIFDNPFLDPAFVDNLCREYAGTVYYQRFILGEWTLAEGLIYPMYEDALETPPDEKPDAVGLSIDYGTQNAFAALLWGKYGATWYLVREYYYSGRDTGVQKTDEEYADALDSFLLDLTQPKEEDEEPMVTTYNKIRTVIDPSAASFIALLKKRGKYRVVPADNAVLDGIRETATCVKNGRIKINPECKNTVRELQGYVWDEKADEDKPVKENDHAADALRYWVKTNRLAKVERQYISPIVGKVYA